MNVMRTSSEEPVWYSAFEVLGIVTFGLSQSFYGLVQAKPQAFPQNYLFAASVLFIVQILPFVLLWGMDVVLMKRSGNVVTFRLWRAILVSLLVLSVLRQIQVFAPSLLERYLAPIPAWVPYVVVPAGFLLMALKWSKGTSVYLRYLGIGSFLLSIFYLIQSDSLRPPVFEKATQSISKKGDEHLPSIYLFVFDELSLDALAPNGRLNDSLFPNVAAFAKDSTWYRNATTNHWSTVDSIPSMLTGQLEPGENTSTIFDLLPEYRTKFVSSEVEVENWVLREANHRGVEEVRGKSYFLSHNPGQVLDYVAGRLLGYVRLPAGENVVLDDPAYHVTFEQQFQYCVDSIDSRKPVFLFWHPSIPHSPFLYKTDGRPHGQTLNYFPFKQKYVPSDFESIFALYKLQIQYADAIFGKILEKMKERGIYEKSIIVFTSDHGLRVWGDLFSHGTLISRIPFLIKVPDSNPTIVDTDFQLMDLVPTLLQSLNRAVKPGTFAGISGGADSPRDKITHFKPSKLQFDSQTGRFSSRERSIAGMATDPNQRLSRKAFSSLYVWDDVMTANQEKRDFLEIYLKKDLPIRIANADLEKLRSGIADSSTPQSPSAHYRLGMRYFFISIWDSYQLTQGNTVDLQMLNRNWRSTQHHLQRSGHLSPELEEQIRMFLKEADADSNGQWSHSELKQMILTRLD